MTLVVPAGRTTTGISLPTSAAATSATVPSPPQAATTSGPREIRSRTIAVASPGARVATASSSSPAKAARRRIASRVRWRLRPPAFGL